MYYTLDRQQFSSVTEALITLYKFFTFFENIFCRAKPNVAARALTKPKRSNDNSVTVARVTPPIIGSKDKYT